MINRNFSFLVILLFIGSCGPSSVCEPHRIFACACDDGTTGVQDCSDRGEWAPCECVPQVSGNEPSGVFEPSGVDGSPNQTGDVTIESDTSTSILETPNTPSGADAGGAEESAPDAGTTDSGMLSASPADSGAPCIPRIAVRPAAGIAFNALRSTQELVTIENVGCGVLDVTGLEIVGAGGFTSDPSIDDFSVADCGVSCDPPIQLCAPATAGCASSAVLAVRYANNDGSADDATELHVRSSDPIQSDVAVSLTASTPLPCYGPLGSIAYSPYSQPGTPVELDASGTNPGGRGGTGSISHYDWSFTYLPGPAGPFNPIDAAITSFVPHSSGSYGVRLIVENDCGAASYPLDVWIDIGF